MHQRPSAPCSPNLAPLGAGFLDFAIVGAPTSTAAVLFLDPCQTSCGLVGFPPACYAGMMNNSLDIGICGILSMPLVPTGGGIFKNGVITGIPAGLRFSVQGVILDPGCSPRGFLFTQANDVGT